MRLAIFDVDGLLLDTEAVWLKAWNEVGARHDILDLTTKACNLSIGRNSQEVLRIAREIMGDIGPQILDEVHEVGSQMMADHIDLKPGAVDLLEFLKAKKIPCAVATSTARDLTMQRLDRTHLLSYFDRIVCGDEVALSKPNPDIYLKVLSYYPFDSREAIVFEDSIAGVEAAYRAHIPCVMVPDIVPPGEPEKERAFAIIDRLDQAIAIINGQD